MVRTVVGEEEVVTPAGTFKAVRVDTEYPKGTCWSKVWYAPGRGAVKTEQGGREIVLKWVKAAPR